MENHPIPQDVTGFKFKLIGSITVKQFLYILGAGALCGLFFILPISFLIKWPMIILIAAIGSGLAFLPIEGRPMDVMLVNFLKALPAENRYVFHKEGATALLHDFFTPQQQKQAPKPESPQQDNRRELLLNQLVRKSAPYKPDEAEREQLNSIKGIFDESNTPVTGIPGLEAPNEQTEIVQPRPSTIVRPPTDTQPQPIKADSPPEEEEQIAPTTPTPAEPAQTAYEPVEQPVEETPAPAPGIPARTVNPEDQVASGFPHIPDTPNVVIGIVKDPRGKVLPNVIVEVLDENRNPVRAFKTNALGQFASATPLPSGRYQIILEDTRKMQEFSPIDIELTGEIFQPLEIISTDQREKLRQELFGNTAQAQ